MATLTSLPTINLSLSFTVNESEARALEALAGYGDDSFIKVFYEKLGKHYMEKHELGLRSFLKTIRALVSEPLSRLDNARAAFK